MLCVTHVATFSVWPWSHLCVKHRSGSFGTLKQWIMFDTSCFPLLFNSQKQSAHWAVDITAQVVSCWLGSWLNRNFWLVLGLWTQLAFQPSERKITWVSCINTVDSGDIQPSEWKIIWDSCIWTPGFTLHLIIPLNWISTESWLRWWYTKLKLHMRASVSWGPRLPSV